MRRTCTHDTDAHRMKSVRNQTLKSPPDVCILGTGGVDICVVQLFPQRSYSCCLALASAGRACHLSSPHVPWSPPSTLAPSPRRLGRLTPTQKPVFSLSARAQVAAGGEVVLQQRLPHFIRGSHGEDMPSPTVYTSSVHSQVQLRSIVQTDRDHKLQFLLK